ncbi:MAG: hypothetical protein WAR24_15730, partial [Candidatus Acidiferrales bacterium]
FGGYEAAVHPWRTVLAWVGLEQHYLIDDTGRPLSARAGRLIAKGRKLHKKARRDHLEDEKRRVAREHGQNTDNLARGQQQFPASD